MSFVSPNQKSNRAQRQQAIQMQMLRNRNLLCPLDETQQNSEHRQML